MLYLILLPPSPSHSDCPLTDPGGPAVQTPERGAAPHNRWRQFEPRALVCRPPSPPKLKRRSGKPLSIGVDANLTDSETFASPSDLVDKRSMYLVSALMRLPQKPRVSGRRPLFEGLPASLQHVNEHQESTQHG